MELSDIRKLVYESLQIDENMQLADKIYFNTGKLSIRAKEVILKITGGDALTKLITDIYYTKLQQSIKQGHTKNDVLQLDDFNKIKSLYLQLKEYNKNIFPIKGFNINGVKNIFELIQSLNYRIKIIEDIKKLPSVAVRNMKNEIRTERDSREFKEYKEQLEYFLGLYSQLGNRDAKLRKSIENKMFRANVTINDLINFSEDKENLLGGKKFTKQSINKIIKENSDDLEIIYEKGNIIIIDVTSPEGIKAIGCNSLWCFTYGNKNDYAFYNQWNQYSTNNHVYAIIDFSEETDSPEFMHVLIKPLDYSIGLENDEENVNDSKLFDMSNQEIYNPLLQINNWVGLDQAPIIFNFGEPVNVEGPTSKWPYEDPNQTKLDLKESFHNLRQLIREELESDGYIYHGTNDARGLSIQREGKMKLPSSISINSPDSFISFSEKPNVAKYYAQMKGGKDRGIVLRMKKTDDFELSPKFNKNDGYEFITKREIPADELEMGTKYGWIPLMKWDFIDKNVIKEEIVDEEFINEFSGKFKDAELFENSIKEYVIKFTDIYNKTKRQRISKVQNTEYKKELEPELNEIRNIIREALESSHKNEYRNYALEANRKLALEMGLHVEGDYVVLYHGTNRKNYNAILKSGMLKSGTWFATDKETSRKYSLMVSNSEKTAVLDTVIVYLGSLYYNGYFSSTEDLYFGNGRYSPKDLKY